MTLIRETDIEAYLREEVETRGGLCKKWVSPGWTGAPDRIVLLPGEWPHFIELKAPGKKPTLIQASRIRSLISIGQRAGWLDSGESVDMFLSSRRTHAV